MIKTTAKYYCFENNSNCGNTNMCSATHSEQVIFQPSLQSQSNTRFDQL